MFPMLPQIKKQNPVIPDSLVLRDVQKIAIKKVIDAYNQGKRSPMVMLSTGGGKSIMAGYIITKSLQKNPNQRIVFVVPRLSLLNQIYETFTDLFGLSVQVIQGTRYVDFSCSVYIATVQTLGSRLKKGEGVWQDLKFSLKFTDEGHIRFDSDQYIKSDMTIALSATPYSKGLANTYDNLIKTRSTIDLVNDGIITKCRILAAVHQMNPDNMVVSSTGDYTNQSETLEANQIIGDVYKEWKNCEDAQGRPFMCVARSIVTCEKLAEIFQENGVNVGVVHSKITEEDNAAILDLFEKGLLDGVMSVSKILEGWDSKVVSCLLLCTSFAADKNNPNVPASPARMSQAFGRVRRSREGKDYALVMDFGNNYIRFGNPDNFELNFDELCDGKKPERKEAVPKERKQKVCPNCQSYIEHGNKCDWCKHTLEKYTEIINGEEIEFLNGKMVEVVSTEVSNKKQKKQVLTNEDKQKLYSGFIYEIENMNNKRIADGKPSVNVKGMVSHRYRNLTGKWPNGLQWRKEYNKSASDWCKYELIRYASRKKV